MNPAKGGFSPHVISRKIACAGPYFFCRHLLAKTWTGRKADEWQESIDTAAKTTGIEFTQENRYNSYAPVREKSFARW